MDPGNTFSKEKIGKMTVLLDKSMGGAEIAQVDFNMADFEIDEHKPQRLFLR
jgi:hypothetical protein